MDALGEKRQRLSVILCEMSPEEREALKGALAGRYYGGNPLPKFMRAKAVELGIAFKEGGRLKPWAYKELLELFFKVKR